MKKFWVKFSLFLTFSLLIPISFIVFRFKLFSTSRQINTITLWAVIALSVLILVVSFMIKFYLDGMKTKYSLIKQILQGVVRVIIPLAIAFILVLFGKHVIVSLKDNYEGMIKAVNNLIQVLVVCIVSEFIAIVINPLPEWAFNNNVEGLAEIYDKIKGGNSEG